MFDILKYQKKAMKKKRFLGLLLAALMICTLFPISAFASSNVAKIGETEYATLQEAIDAAKEGDTITLLTDASGNGLKTQKDDNFTLDLGGYAYVVTKTVGSSGTETNGTQFLKGGQITIKNGSMTFENAKIGIKNYANLTIENVVLSGTSTTNPIINNCGQLTIKGMDTDITSPGKWSITTGNYEKGDKIFTNILEGRIDSVACETPLWEVGGATESEEVEVYVGAEVGKIGVYDWRNEYPGYENASLLKNWEMTLDCKNGCETLEFPDEYLDNVEVIGGTYGQDVSKYVKDPSLKCVEEDGRYLVAPKATALTLSKENILLKSGETDDIGFSIEPKNCIDTVIFKSSNEKVVTVDESGEITAVGPGKAVVTVTASQSELSKSCNISVYEISKAMAPFIDDKVIKTPTIGIASDFDLDVLNTNISLIIDKIKNGEDVSEEVMSKETADAIKVALADGKTIDVELNVVICEKDKLSEEILKNIITSRSTDKIAQHLDIAINIKADNETLGTVNKLKRAITLQVAVPEEIAKNSEKIYVIRTHKNADGKFESSRIPTQKTEDGKYIIVSDSFSTYSIAYRAVNDEETTNQEQEQDGNGQGQTPDQKESSDAPNTGDASSVLIISFVMAVCLLGVTIIAKKATNK